MVAVSRLTDAVPGERMKESHRFNYRSFQDFLRFLRGIIFRFFAKWVENFLFLCYKLKLTRMI